MRRQSGRRLYRKEDRETWQNMDGFIFIRGFVKTPLDKRRIVCYLNRALKYVGRKRASEESV